MSEMIERVAFAIFSENFRPYTERTIRTYWADEAYVDARLHAFRTARAAIQAMREPTVAMIDSGVAFALNVSLGGDYRWSDYVADKHRAMIQAALTPTGETQ